jgi:hypothetical protein
MSLIRRVLTGGAVVGTIAGVALGGPAASATPARVSSQVSATAIHYSVRTAEVQGCYAALDSQMSGGVWYVRARFYSRYVSCYGGNLQRRKGSGSYRQISHTYSENPGHWSYTGWHKDPSPYRARACTMSDTFVGKCTASF